MLTTIQEHSFLTRGLGPEATVLDLGANRGAFAREIVERFGARCLAVEANAELAEQMPVQPGLSVHHLAIGGRDGLSDFHISTDSESSGLVEAVGGAPVRTEHVREATFETFLAEQGLTTVELVKVDIEGAEKPLFDTASDEALRGVAQFTVEFHDFAGLLSQSDVARIERRLVDLGFRSIKVTRTNYNRLFYQPDRCRVGRVEDLATRYVERNLRYVARNARRVLSSRSRGRWP